MLGARSIVALLACSAAGCSGTNTPASNLAPTTIPTANRPPEIVTAAVTPASGGWTYLTTFSVHAGARDPDGDALTITWTSFTGKPLQGTVTNAGADIVFTVEWESEPINSGPLTLTVTDARGASTTSGRIFFDHQYFRNAKLRGRIGNKDGIYLLLNQTKASLTGTIMGLGGGGVSDAAGPGTIDAQGNFRIRFKFARDLEDITLVGNAFKGQLTGIAYGRGVEGERFVFEPEYS